MITHTYIRAPYYIATHVRTPIRTCFRTVKDVDAIINTDTCVDFTKHVSYLTQLAVG